MFQIHTKEAVDNLLKEEKVLIFKHSTQCGISSSAFQEVNKLDFPVYLVRVIEERDVSNYIEEKLGVKHESPQVLLIKNGKCVWHASHRAINEEIVKEKFNEEVCEFC